MIGEVRKSMIAKLHSCNLQTMSDDELTSLRSELAQIRDEAQHWLTEALNEKHARLSAEVVSLRDHLAARQAESS